jgi:tRNA-Thr(GGU) m(6)t(6)A37 methyltransferase TsaA
MKKIEFSQIGVIDTPFKEQKNIPIQASFGEDIEASCRVFDKYTEGLKDLEGFSHAILIYYFHKCKQEKLIAKPYLEDEEHGIFAIRSPYRPNKIGFSIVKIKNIIGNTLCFTEVDMLDGTPLLDIKPYVAHFDSRKNTKSGWIDKHFIDGKIPQQIILNKK